MSVEKIVGCGNHTCRGYLDANGSSAQLMYPRDIIPLGNYLYVCDQGNNCIRKISINSPYTVTTLTGKPNQIEKHLDGDLDVALFNSP